jgi:hypothetical protein
MQTDNTLEDGAIQLTTQTSLRPEITGAAAASVEPSSTKDEEQNGAVAPAITGLGISYRRLVIIMIGLCLAIFLTALEQVNENVRDHS